MLALDERENHEGQDEEQPGSVKRRRWWCDGRAPHPDDHHEGEHGCDDGHPDTAERCDDRGNPDHQGGNEPWVEQDVHVILNSDTGKDWTSQTANRNYIIA